MSATRFQIPQSRALRTNLLALSALALVTGTGAGCGGGGGPAWHCRRPTGGAGVCVEGRVVGGVLVVH